MGEEDSYEMMYQATHDTNKFYQIKFYDSENEDLSFFTFSIKTCRCSWLAYRLCG